MFLVFDSAVDCFGGGPKADDEGGFFEEVDVAVVGGQSAARGNHRPLPFGDFLCEGAF